MAEVVSLSPAKGRECVSAGCKLMSRLRSYLPNAVKRIVWNVKHRATPIDANSCPKDILDQMGRLSPDGRLLDFGCGAGNLRQALRQRGWRGHYTGVDVSEQALKIAKSAGDQSAEWHECAIEKFATQGRKFDLICFCESIYYVRISQIPGLLRSCREAMATSNSRIVVRICDPVRHNEYVQLLMQQDAETIPPIYLLS